MLPREIKAEHWPDHSTFDLPIRPLGKLRYFGLLPLVFSLLFAAVPVSLFWRPLQTVFKGNSGIRDVILVVFVCVFLLGTLAPFGLGLFILAGRTRLVVTLHGILITEITGPFRRSRRLHTRDIHRLELG